MYRKLADYSQNIGLPLIQNYVLKGIVGICLFFISNSLCSQNLTFFEDILDKKQLAKIEEAIKLKDKANGIFSEISSLNQEMLALETNYDLSQKQFDKQSKKIDSKVQGKIEEANKLYASANESIFEILKEAIEENENQDESKLLAIEYAKKEFTKASDLRKNAENVIGTSDKAELISTANESEQKAIDELSKSLAKLSGKTEESYISPEVGSLETSTDITVEPGENSVIYPTESSPVSTIETTATPIVSESTYEVPVPTTGEYDDLSVNQKMIESYDEYVSNEQIPDPITIDQIKENASDSATQQYWTEYQNTTPPNYSDNNKKSKIYDIENTSEVTASLQSTESSTSISDEDVKMEVTV
ncbi:MAG: hypothetical protein MI922_29320, partial [Bacteroidales bacterium]|nr:hypothetical protein [Bacteroidales bacterium]